MEQIENLRKSSAVRRTPPAGRNAPLPEVVYNCALFQRGIFRFSVFLPFLPLLLSGLFVRIELPGDNSGMALYLDFSLLLAALYVPVAFIGEEETALKALEAMQIQEEDYFCHVTHRTWDAILHAIREAHKDDTNSAPDGSNALNLIKDAKKALAVPGSYLDVFTALMCTQLQIQYEKLSEQERTVLKNVMKKTPAYRDSPLGRMKRR